MTGSFEDDNIEPEDRAKCGMMHAAYKRGFEDAQNGVHGREVCKNEKYYYDAGRIDWAFSRTSGPLSIRGMSEAYKRGQDAYATGVPASAVPREYKAASTRAMDWVYGWLDACEAATGKRTRGKQAGRPMTMAGGLRYE